MKVWERFHVWVQVKVSRGQFEEGEENLILPSTTSDKGGWMGVDDDGDDDGDDKEDDDDNNVNVSADG